MGALCHEVVLADFEKKWHRPISLKNKVNASRKENVFIFYLNVNNSSRSITKPSFLFITLHPKKVRIIILLHSKQGEENNQEKILFILSRRILLGFGGTFCVKCNCFFFLKSTACILSFHLNEKSLHAFSQSKDQPILLK